MGAPKGHKGYKPKGSITETTKRAKELVMASIDEQSIYFNDTMKEVRESNPIEWTKLMIKLMDFVLPKKIDVTTDGDKINNIPVASWMQDDKT